MGLTLAVGWLAEQASELDDEEFSQARTPYDLLNDVLVEAGAPRHNEPLNLEPEQIWSSDMWGYGGLHAIRRLAAHFELRGCLPPPGKYEDFANDPVTEELNRRFLEWLEGRRGIRRLFRGSMSKPRFQHLLWHSDAEGFYIPTDFDDVILDNSIPQRAGVGGMVGSSSRLLEECRDLAELIALPKDMDEEDDALLDAAEAPGQGSDWRRFGVEAFGIVRLIAGCERSIATKAALVFG